MDLERVAAFSHFKSQELHLGGDRTELEMPCYCGQNQRCNTYERNKMKIFSQKTSEEYGVAAAFFFSFWYAVLWSFYEFLTIRGLLFMHRSEISPLSSSHCLFHPHENWMACSTFFLSFANIRKLLETIRSLMCETSEERKVGKLGRRTTKAQRSRSNKNNIRKTNLANKIKNKHHPLLYYFFQRDPLQIAIQILSGREMEWIFNHPEKISESTFFPRIINDGLESNTVFESQP